MLTSLTSVSFRQYYLPPYEQITKDHLKGVLSGKKNFLKMHQVRFCNAPAYDEIGVKALYEKVIKQPDMAQYFPDKFPKGQQCDKQYLYNVWNSMHPEDVQKLFEHANSVRYSLEADKVKEETILITDAW